MKKLVQKIIIILCSYMIVFPLYADDKTDTKAEPYTADEFPQFMKNARRAEIISFGAMPFITLSTTLGYSLVRYCQHNFSSDYIPNPFAKTSDSNGFSEDEQKTILLTSIGISVGIGLTDFIVNIIKQNIKKQKNLKENTGPIQIVPIEQDKDAVLIQPPSPPDGEQEKEDNQNSDKISNVENNTTGE
jgi:hypothetical protein